MRYPSEILRAAADKVDAAEDWVLDRDWRVWDWPSKFSLKTDIEIERAKRHSLARQYNELYREFVKKTGESPDQPHALVRAGRNFEELKRQIAAISRRRVGA